MLKFKNYLYILFIGFYILNCKSPKQACYQSKCSTSTANCLLTKQYLDDAEETSKVIKQEENDETLTNSKNNDYTKGALILKSFKNAIEIKAKFKDKDDVDNYYFEPDKDVEYELKYIDTKKDISSCNIFLYATEQAQINEDFLDNKDPSLLKAFGEKLGDITEEGYKLSLEKIKNKKAYNYIFINCKPKNAITSSENYSFRVDNNTTTSKNTKLKDLLSLKTEGTGLSSYFINEKVSDSLSNKKAKNTYTCEQSKKECYQRCNSVFSF